MTIAIGIVFFLLGGFMGAATMCLLQVGGAADRDARRLHDLSENERN
jgi:hypothetical protein